MGATPDEIPGSRHCELEPIYFCGGNKKIIDVQKMVTLR
jgi:hypothetical protein